MIGSGSVWAATIPVMVTQAIRAARRVRLHLPGRTRPWLWIAAAVSLTPVGLVDLRLWYVSGALTTDTLEQMQAWQSKTNPWFWILTLPAVLIVTCTIGSVVLQVLRRSPVLVLRLAAISVVLTTGLLAIDAALVLGLTFGPIVTFGLFD
jgi:hypothetical protein